MRTGTTRWRFARKLACAVVLAAFALASRDLLDAQILVAAPVDPAADAESAPPAFTVLKADSKTIELLDDFDRYAGKKSWELAFRALNSLNEVNNRGMVPAKGGFLVPIGARMKQSLLGLPPEGREAYRLFNDSGAKQLWEHAQNPKGNIPADEMASLRKLVDGYFLTSVGDLAADRLGDALFEQGDFAGAEEMWRLVVEKYPDSHLPPAKLQVKRFVALARLGRRDALSALAAQVREQFADQNVTIGGKEVAAGEFVQSLIPRDTPSQPTSVADADAILLPTVDEPLWQIRVVGPNLSGQVDPQTGMPMNSSSFHMAPSGAVDDKRFYANWLGTVYAADLATGKMLWRTGKFTDTAQQVMTFLQQGLSPDNFFLTSAGGKLLVMRQGSSNILGQLLGGQSPQDGQLTLECLDALSGKTLWSLRGLASTIVSPPYLFDGVGYLVGISRNNSAMNLLAINLATGQDLWTVELGTPQNANNWRGGFNFGGPKILATGGMLYVATNNGALLAISLANHRIEWALQNDTKPNTGNQRFFFNGMVTTVAESPGTLLDDEGVFYLKDGSGRLLYALEPAGPSVKWKRPLAAEESVFAIDGPIAYLLGHELSALDLKTRKLLWATKIPGETAAVRPLVCQDHIYVPTERGIFDLDPANGDIRRVFRGADRDSGAGKLLVAGDKLICINDTAVTAYPIQRAKSPKITTRTSQ